MKLRTRPAAALVECASREAAALSFEIRVDELVLAAAVLGDTLAEYGADAETIRDRIHEREREALASLGISLDAVREQLEDVPCDLPISPEAKRILDIAARRRRFVTSDQLLATLIKESPRARRLLFELDVPVGTLQDRLTR
jgi:Clp amino terminal domain, pathogenicity island component